MIQRLFSFEGRIRRSEYGISFLVLAIVFGILNTLVKEAATSGLLFFFYIPLQWILIAQGAKRAHDMDKSGWWQLVPFFNIWTVFSQGTVGPNQYGPDPKQSTTISSSVNSNPAPPVSSGSAGYQGGYGGGHNSNGSPSTYSPARNTDSGYRSGDLYK